MPSLLTHLRTLTRYLFISFLIFGTGAALAQAASYYVSPNGGGSTCSNASPCALNEGLNKAGAGDKIILKNGVYNQQLRTRRNGTSGNFIVIRAENRHHAIIRNTDTDAVIDIVNNFIIVRGLKADGTRSGAKGSALVDIKGATNVVFEDNWATDGGNAGIGIKNASNIVFRHNIVEHTGYDNEQGLDTVGEGFYLGNSSTNRDGTSVRNVEIYGNVIRDVGDNFIDYKYDVTNVNAHHNIFEKYRLIAHAKDGFVRSAGANNTAAGNYFTDNIVRDSIPGALYILRIDGNRVDVTDNVFYNLGGNQFIDSRTTSSAIITDNTLCNAPSGGNGAHSNWSPNKVNQPQSVCDAEVARITNELKSLPGAGSGFPAGGVGVFTPGPCALYPAFIENTCENRSQSAKHLRTMPCSCLNLS